MRSFYALVEFTDVNGHHPASTLVNMPYDTPDQILAVESMLAYGVLSLQAPPPSAASLRPNDEAPVVAEAQAQVQPVVLLPNDESPASVADEKEAGPKDDPETPYFDARDDKTGRFVEETPDKEPVQEPQADLGKPVEVAEPKGAKDDPETPFFDARDDDGTFAKEGTPLGEDKPAPKKRVRKR